MVSPQAPIASPFGYRSTAREVVGGIDLSGRRVVVTGGYSGIGTETVRALAGAGAHIIVGARRPDQAQDVLCDTEGEIAVLALDLSDPASIVGFAEAVAGRWDAIDILINNAAIMASPLMRDARGYEMQFATNHLGHFQLAARLWPLLAAGGGARGKNGTGGRALEAPAVRSMDAGRSTRAPAGPYCARRRPAVARNHH